MKPIKISKNVEKKLWKFFDDSKFSTNFGFCLSTFCIFCWFVEFCWFSTNVDLLIYFCWICWFVEICWKINKNKKSTSDFENGSTKTKINKWFSRIFGALVPTSISSSPTSKSCHQLISSRTSITNIDAAA